MKLQELPVDVLQQILNGHNAWAALELWKCGSRVLMSKLANYGITDVILRASRVITSARWPTCLKHFHLRSLDIHLSGAFLPIKHLRSELLQMQRGLISLKLCFENSTEAILSGHPSPLFQLKQTHLDPSNPSLDPSSGASSLFNPWTDPFGSLQTLEVNPSRSISFFPEGIFGLLPRSLTSLFISKFVYSGDCDFSHLPPSLTRLHLSEHSISESNIRTLPNSITDLGEGVSEAVLGIVVADPLLLPNLTSNPVSFTLEWAPDKLDIIGMRSKGLARVDKIDVLRVHDIAGNDFVPNLPTHLTKLVLSGILQSHDLLSHQIKLLPATLTHLEVETIEWASVEASFWPPNLVQLVYNDEQGCLNLEHFHKLPRSLTSFEGAIGTMGGSDVDLISLRRFGQLALALDSSRWLDTQKSLLNYQQNSGFANMEYIQDYISNINEGYLLGLPLGLKIFDVIPLDVEPLKSLLLPPWLSSLTWVEEIPAPNSFLWTHLPPFLSALELVEIGRWDDWGYWAEHKGLASLKTLVIDLMIAPGLKAFEIFNATSHLLQSISLFCEEYAITPQMLESLPPNLNSLLLACNNVTLGADDINALPRSLRTLEIRGAPITGPAWSVLPPTLTKLQTDFTMTTLDEILSAPRRLTHLNTRLYSVRATRNDRGGYLGETSNIKRLLSTYAPFWRIFSAPRDEILQVLAASMPIPRDMVD